MLLGTLIEQLQKHFNHFGDINVYYVNPLGDILEPRLKLENDARIDCEALYIEEEYGE